jgi:hypothetical protein
MEQLIFCTWLKIVMGGAGIFLQDYWDRMCMRMQMTPSFLLSVLDVISLAASWMQLWWWLVH